MDLLICDSLSRMGLALPVAILVAVRVGQIIHQMNSKIWNQKTDLAIDLRRIL